MKCIIVEDEFPAREELKYYLKNTGLDLTGEFSNSQSALEFLYNNEIDVIFLDINMPGLDGIALGRILSNFKNKPKIIFTTAYKEYALEAFELNAFDYLLKPYDEKRIKTCIARLLDEFCAREENSTEACCKINRLSLWQGEKLLVKSFDEILFVEACERESKVYISDGSILISKMCISKLESLLDANIFFKTHRSYIVNIDFIKEIIPWTNSTYMLKVLNSEKDIPVSRNKIKDFKLLMHIS